MIILVGLPGSGKSTVGRQLARRLGLGFVDSDEEIERRLGCSIREYFEREGEAAFRDREEAVLAQLTQGTDEKMARQVLATGGGAVLREANRQRLAAAGRVVYLHATPQDLYQRLRHDHKRPLLQGGDPLQKLHDLYAARDPLYRKLAHVQIDACSGPKIAHLVDALVKEIHPLQQP